MTKATAALTEKGATAENWFIHTPVCCPSRAELLTSRYFHNLRVRKPTDHGCMYVNTSADSGIYDKYYFAPHLQQAGYTVGIFGKHLNNANPVCPPAGVDRFFANGGKALNKESERQRGERERREKREKFISVAVTERDLFRNRHMFS